MNQVERMVKRICCMCKKKYVWVRQTYNCHISDWEDSEIPICVDCEEAEDRRIMNERY